jgi:hypothetical protein
MQNLMSSSLVSKHLNTKIYRTVILPVVVYGCKIWSLTLREDVAAEGLRDKDLITQIYHDARSTE